MPVVEEVSCRVLFDGFIAGALFFETPCSILKALPRVAKVWGEAKATLTARHVVACCYKLVHILVHCDELVLSERLPLFPINQSLGDLFLEPSGLYCVDDLQCY